MAAGADSLGVAVLELTADPTPLNAMLASSERRTEMSMARMEAMSGKRLATVGQNMSRLGSQWNRTVTLPIVAGGAAMIKVASDFEGALTQVQTQAGASAGELENMRKAILKLAPATGQTPVQLANALFHVESAGLRGAKALDVLTQSAKLAKIGHSDLEQTTSALVAVMKSAPKDVKNATDAIGLMNAVVGQGNMRMGDLVGALSTGIIPAAKSAGLGLRDVGAAIDVMTTRGIPAQLAATRLAMSISLMSAPTGKAAKELASVGLKGDQLATDLRKPDGLVVAVQDLKTHMDAAGLSATQQNALIAHAFGGGRSSKAILTLVQNTGDLQKAFDGIGKHSGAGVVAAAWKKSQEDIGVRLDKLKATAQAAFVDIGTKIAPEFIKVGTQVADDATKIANAFSSLPKGAQDLIITGGLTAAALGPVMRLAGVLTTFVGRTWDALKVAEGLATGKRTLFGGLKAAESAGGRVANMEVGEMIVRNMIGGPGGPGGVSGAKVGAAEGAGAAGAGEAAGAAGATAVSIAASLPLLAGVLGSILGPSNKAAVTQQLLKTGTVNPRAAASLSPLDKQQVGLIVDADKALKQFGSTGNASGINRVASSIKALEKQFPSTKQGLDAVLRTMDTATHGTLPSLAGAAKSAGNEIVDKFGGRMRTARDLVENTTGDARKVAIANYTRLQDQAGNQFDSLERKVASSQAKMTASIRTGSANLAAVAAANFGKFERSVQNAMASGVVSTSKGMELITKALNATLKAFGEKPLAVATVQNLTPAQLGAVASGQVSSGAAASPHARGGLLQVGRPGEKGHDTVPMNVGGTPIMVAPGEKVAVFNDAQQHIMNRRLADYGGLPGFFGKVNRPHYMATGGYVYPFPPGTTLGRTDEGVDASMPAGAPIGPIGDSTIKGVTPNWYAGQPLLYWQLTDGPRAGRYVYLAEQINNLRSGHVRANQAVANFAPSGTGIEMGWATPGGQALASGHYTEGAVTAEGIDFRNFILGLAHGVIRGGGALGGLSVPTLRAPGVKGTGTIARIVRAALGKDVGAANAFLSKHISGSGGLGGSTAGLSGNLRQIVGQLSKRFGWTGQEDAWLQVIQQESGGSMTAKNPSSGAYGIAQFINGPGEYAKYGGDVNTMAGQLLAMANYIKGRYGGPSAAEAHERAFNWYSRGGWVRTGATEDNFTGGRMQTGYPTSYNHGNTFAQLLMGGANAGKHPNLSDLLGMGGGILPAGFPIDIRYGGRELDDVRRIDTGSGALDGSTHWTVDIESPAARRLRFPGKGDIMVRAHDGKDGKSADPHAGMHRVRYWQKGAKGKHPGRWAHKWVKNKPNAFKLPKFHAMAGFDPSDMAKIQAIEDYLNNRLSPWQGLITGIHGRVPVPPKSVADRLAEIGHLGDPPDLNTELGIDQKFLDEYFTESVLAGQAQQKFGPWLTKMLKDRKTQQDKIDDTQATIDRLKYLKARLPQERKDRDYAITTRFLLARHKLQTSSARGTFDAGQLLSDQLSGPGGLNDEEKKARQAIPSKPPPGWSGTKAGWAAQRNRELGNVSSEFADRREALKKAAKEHKFEGRLSRSNALFGLTQEERAEKLKLSDVFSGRALDLTERLKDQSLWLARYKRLLTSDETALTAATGSKDGTVVTGSGSFEDTLLNLLDPMGPLAINIATKKDIDIPTLLDEINTLTGTDTTTGTSAQLAPLLQQQNANLEQQLAVSQDQYRVLSQLPPFGGSFLSGGTVPGMLGEPRTIIAHGGETISPAGDGAGIVHEHNVIFGPKTRWLEDFVDARVEHRTRQMSRGVKALPGARAGQLNGR